MGIKIVFEAYAISSHGSVLIFNYKFYDAYFSTSRRIQENMIAAQSR